MVQPNDELTAAQRQVKPSHAVRQEHRNQAREQHAQRIKEADARQPASFDATQFVGYVDPLSIKFDRFGTMSITFRCPPEFRDYCMPLINAGGMLLSVDVQKWDEVVEWDDEDG